MQDILNKNLSNIIIGEKQINQLQTMLTNKKFDENEVIEFCELLTSVVNHHTAKIQIIERLKSQFPMKQ